MPIKPENKARYPKIWPRMRAEVLERAGYACEGSPLYPSCRARQYAVAKWDEAAQAWIIDVAPHLKTRTYQDARQICAENSIGWEAGDPKWIVIVLTVAHLDHDDLETTRTDRLRALCQRCHLLYDLQQHQANAYQTRRKHKALGDLFDGKH